MTTPRDAVQFERRRFDAIAQHQEGIRQAEIARRLKVSRQSVSRWLRTHRKGGFEALRCKPRPGRPAKLTLPQRRTLLRVLARGAEKAGYSTQLWTAERIRKVVWDRFGVRLHVNHVPKMLKTCGWSYQRPTGRAKERNEAAIRRWMEVDWPRIKKKPAGSRPHWSSPTRADSG